MVLRRSDERRRRVVMDEAMQAPAIESESPGDSAQAEPPVKLKRPKQYSKGADRRNQPRPSDFIPVGRISLLWLGLLISSLLFAITILDGITSGPRAIAQELNWAFDAKDGALPTWLRSIFYFSAGLYCLVIFGIRQHRSNDYRGTYRVWRWLAAICLFASSSCIVDWPKLVGDAVGHFSKRSIHASDLWMLTLEAVGLLTVLGRLALELKSSRSALTCAIGLGGFALATILFQAPIIKNLLGSNGELVAGWLLCLTAVSCFLTVLLYGRFVALHAAGIIYVPDRLRSKKKKKKKVRRSKAIKTRSKSESRTRDEDDEEVNSDFDEQEVEADARTSRGAQQIEPTKSRSEPTSKPSQPPLFSKMQRPAATNNASGNAMNKPSSSYSGAEDDEDERDDDSSNSKLSKAERKRLKREQRANRRAA